MKQKQKELQIDALQLLTYQSPLSALLLFLIIPFYDQASGMSFEHYLNRSNTEWVNKFKCVSITIALPVRFVTYVPAEGSVNGVVDK